MMWKLCIALLAVQVSCLLADSHETVLGELLSKLMDRRSSEEGSMEDERDDQEVLRMYMEKNGIKEGEDPLERLFYNYMELSGAQIQYVLMLQGSDLTTNAVINNIFHSEEGVSDFAKHLVMESIKHMVPKADDSKLIMGMLFDYIYKNPDADNKEMAMRLLYQVTAGQSKEDKSLLRVMMLELINWSQGDKKEVVMELLGALMTEELGGEIDNGELLLLFIQHLANQQPFDGEKRTMVLYYLHSLSQRTDAQGKKILRDLITSLVYTGSFPTEVEEDDRWKYMGSGPCRVEENGNEVSSHECAKDMSCDVGPVRYSFQGRNYDYFMCRFPDEYLEYFAFHSCKVIWPGNVVDERPNCPTSTCDFGPFTATVEGELYQAYFCSDYNNYTVDYTQWDPRIIRACAIEDMYTGFRPVQRKCPTGQYCYGKPAQVDFEGFHFNTYMCQDATYSDDGLLLKLVNTMLGYEDDGEMSDDMMGGARVANMTEERSANDFMQYIIMELYEHMNRNQGGDDKGEADMNSDVQLYEVIKFLVETMANNDPLMGQFLEVLETKFHLGVISDADRVFVKATIAQFMSEWSKMEKSDERDGMDGDLAALLKQLGEHNEQHDRLAQLLKYADEQDDVSSLYRMLRARADDNKSEEDDKIDEADVLKKLLESLLGDLK